MHSPVLNMIGRHSCTKDLFNRRDEVPIFLNLFLLRLNIVYLCTLPVSVFSSDSGATMSLCPFSVLGSWVVTVVDFLRLFGSYG